LECQAKDLAPPTQNAIKSVLINAIKPFKREKEAPSLSRQRGQLTTDASRQAWHTQTLQIHSDTTHCTIIIQDNQYKEVACFRFFWVYFYIESIVTGSRAFSFHGVFLIHKGAGCLCWAL
jgi:hypothetical protein